MTLLNLTYLLFFLLIPSSNSVSFLKQNAWIIPSIYRDADLNRHYRIQQVPGDGSCLFHALAVSIEHMNASKYCDYNTNTKKIAYELRRKAVSILNRTTDPLYIQDNECIHPTKLLTMISMQYNMTPEEYCQSMLCTSSWGGGPEIVALSNFLHRPIHIYELHASTHHSSGFVLKRTSSIGSPKFSYAKPLEILYADGRFPDITPGQQSDPNHFLSLFEEEKPSWRGFTRFLSRSFKIARSPKQSKHVDESSAYSDQLLKNFVVNCTLNCDNSTVDEP